MLYLVKDPTYRSIRFRVFIENGFKLVRLEYKEFPDGEMYFRFLEDIDPRGVYLVLVRGFPDQERNILRAEMFTDTLHDLGAEKVILCMPYLPYARQDKRFLPGEPISVMTVAKRLAESSDVLVTVDVHNEEALSFLGDKFINIDTSNLWASVIRRLLDPKETLLIAPDIGRRKLVDRISGEVSVETLAFIKTRDRKTGKIIQHEPEDAERYTMLLSKIKNIVIIDDILATGGTMASIIARIRRDGFSGRVFCMSTHGLFLKDAYDKLVSAGADIILTTDTVENSFIYPEASVCPLILKELRTRNII